MRIVPRSWPFSDRCRAGVWLNVVVVDGANEAVVLKSSQRVLVERFGIHHTTIQIDRCDTCGQAHHDVHELSTTL